jgi:hypothetical protein
MKTFLIVGGIVAAYVAALYMAGEQLAGAELACVTSQTTDNDVIATAANNWGWDSCPGVVAVINKYNWLPGFGVGRPDGD